jgi:hypothetical protein
MSLLPSIGLSNPTIMITFQEGTRLETCPSSGIWALPRQGPFNANSVAMWDVVFGGTWETLWGCQLCGKKRGTPASP